MKSDKVLTLGNPNLHKVSDEVQQEELPELNKIIEDMHDILFEYKDKYNAFRGIAAPQIGVLKRLIYIFLDKPIVIINPTIINKSDEMFEVWDDCMCFPELFVKVKRHKTCTINYFDENFEQHSWDLSGDLSELLQHEYDHLDGIVATQKAIDLNSFKWRI